MPGLNDLIINSLMNTSPPTDGNPITPADLDTVMQEVWSITNKPHPHTEEGHLILNEDEVASLNDRGVVMIHDAGRITVIYNEKIRGTVYEQVLADMIERQETP
jgi:hypothetical protein